MTTNALQALKNPEAIASPLKRFFSIEPADTLYIFILKENLTKLKKKLEAPVNSYCRTASDLRRSSGKRPPRAFADLDPKTGQSGPDSGITYNRNVFRLTGMTTRRQIVNTVIHEYAHLVRVGHGEPELGSPIDNKNSTKVRGFTKDEAINSAEVLMRFIRAVT